MDLNTKFHQINNALASAAASINLARTMLKDLELQVKDTKAESSTPGTVGKFIGDSMVTTEGVKIEIPANYSAKSMLVYGDTIKMVEENGDKKFKQIERVKRYRTEGIIAKKEGKWHAVTADASYRVSDAAMEYFEGKDGSVVTVQIPLEEKYAPFATIEILDGKEMGAKKTHEAVNSLTIEPMQTKEIKPVSSIAVASVLNQQVEPSLASASEPKPDVLAEAPVVVEVSQVIDQPKPKPIQASKPAQKSAQSAHANKYAAGHKPNTGQRQTSVQKAPHQFNNTGHSAVASAPRPAQPRPVAPAPQVKPQAVPANLTQPKVQAPSPVADTSRVLTDEDLR